MQSSTFWAAIVVSAFATLIPVFFFPTKHTMLPLTAIRASNAAFAPSYTPVAVFIGGTSGIGQGMVETFARNTNGNSQIIIIGRNRAAAEFIISSLPKPTITGVSHEFIQCDVTLMKNVQSVSRELLGRFPKINLLVMSPGVMTMKGRDETEEGIDRKLAVHYYARWKAIAELLPALRQAKEDGEDAKVISVLAAGKGGEINLNDLGLKNTYSLTNAGLAAPTYNDLMMEEFAAQNSGLAFIHAYPGLVRTKLLASSDSPFLKASSSLLYALAYPFSTSATDCSEYMLHALLNSTKGASRTGSRGEDIGMKRYFGSEEARKKLWEHTKESVHVLS